MKKINPLNKDDIKKFKMIAYNSIIKGDPSPFALKLVGKDDNQVNTPTTYSKSNEVTSDLVNQWSNKFVSTFKANLRQELSNVILNVLENNPIIKTKIYIKPYVLDENKNQEECYENIDNDLNDSHEQRFMWYFGNDEHGKSLSIQSKPLKLDDFNNLASIFMSRAEFQNNFNIKNEDLPKKSPGFIPNYEFAEWKNDNWSKYFYKKCNIYANNPKTQINSQKSSTIVASILEKSRTYTKGTIWDPKYHNNYMLTFGIRPYIDESELNGKKLSFTYDNKEYEIDSFSKLISDLISMPNSQNSTKDSQSNNISFQEYVYNKTLEELKGTSIYNFLNQYEYTDVVGGNILSEVLFQKDLPELGPLYNYNIFNHDVASGVRDWDPNDNDKKKTPQFSRDVYDKLCDRFGIKNNQYDDFNSAIDMHQFTYYDTTQHTSYVSDQNYLGAYKDTQNKIVLTNIFLDNFINIGDIKPTDQIPKNYTDNSLTNNFKAIITYNDMPVFEINNNCLDRDSNKQLVNNLLNASKFKKNDSSTTTQTYSEDSFDPDLFTNISTSYSIVDDKTRTNKSNNYVINNTLNVEYKDDNSNLITVSVKDGLSPTYNHLPTDNSNPSTMDRGIYDAVSLYNQNIQKLNLSSNTNNGLLEYNKPTDFLMLFDATGNENQVTPLKLHYCETYSGVDNINLSLSSQFTNSKLAFNYDQLSELKERLKVFNTPAKVYFIYHNDNLLIKDKIEYNASNPDFIDNPELVIQNALRKYGLAPETDHIMYNIGNSYVSLLNNVFVLYNFTLNDRNYYFDSFANAKDKLISYIKYNSYKI